MPVRCLLFLCICLANTLFAQTFNATPGPLLEKEVEFDQANECYIHFNNPGGDSLRLHWRVLESSIPAGWDADICDYGFCYFGIPSNGLMSPVADTIQPYLKLIVQPGAVPGAAWLWFRVYEEGNPENFNDVFFSLFTPGTSATHTADEPVLKVYPNPASDFLFLENKQSAAVTARLTNSNGQVLRQENIPEFSKKQISLSDLPPGPYFLQNGNKTQTILLHK